MNLSLCLQLEAGAKLAGGGPSPPLPQGGFAMFEDPPTANTCQAPDSTEFQTVIQYENLTGSTQSVSFSLQSQEAIDLSVIYVCDEDGNPVAPVDDPMEIAAGQIVILFVFMQFVAPPTTDNTISVFAAVDGSPAFQLDVVAALCQNVLFDNTLEMTSESGGTPGVLEPSETAVFTFTAATDNGEAYINNGTVSMSVSPGGLTDSGTWVFTPPSGELVGSTVFWSKQQWEDDETKVYTLEITMNSDLTGAIELAVNGEVTPEGGFSVAPEQIIIPIEP